MTLKWTGPVKILPKGQLESNLMFKAKAREYLKGACHHFFVPATEVQEIFIMELLAIPKMSEARSEHKVCFGAS